MTVRFDAVLSRGGPDVLADIFGSQLIELVTTLQKDSANQANLRSLLIEVFSPEVILQSKDKRRNIIDLLRLQEAKELANDIGIKDSEDVFKELKNSTFPRSQFLKLLSFFEISPGIEPELIDETPNLIEIEPKYSLFKHQRNAISMVLQVLEKSPHRVVLHMPTGAGKTRTAMNIISQYLRISEPTLILWLANSEELCEQAAEEFIKSWTNTGNRAININRFWGKHSLDRNIKDGIIIAGFQKIYSMQKNSPAEFAFFGEKITLIVVDEAHQVIADTYKLVVDAVLARRPDARLIGLTATPGRTWNDIDADEKLANFFGRKKVTLKIDGYDNPVNYLIENGYLAKPNFVELKLDSFSDAEKSKIYSDFEISDNLLKKLADDSYRTLKILRRIEDLATRHKRILVFATTVEHSELLAVLLKYRGLNARSLTGNTPGIDRQKMIDWYKEHANDIRILCNFGILTTGFDAPKTSAAVIARPTKSLVLFSQMVGRATRGTNAGGNKEAEIVTVTDIDLPGFRNMSESFSNWEDIWE
jgi:superfamily II DNA or RNA helicase